MATEDFDAAIDFYGNTLGLPESKRWGDMPAAEFETGNLTIAVMQSDAFGLDFRANNHPIELRVDDVAEARGELESRGVSFEGEILDSGVCHQTFFADPDGNALALHHRYARRLPNAGGGGHRRGLFAFEATKGDAWRRSSSEVSAWNGSSAAAE